MPIDVAVQGWYGDGFAVVEVDGSVDADSCGVLAGALVRAGQIYRAVIIDLTRVDVLSAAGLHCLDCVGQTPSRRPGSVHLVCPESSVARRVMHTVHLHHRWPLHAQLTQAIRQVTQQLLAEEGASPPEQRPVADDKVLIGPVG